MCTGRNMHSKRTYGLLDSVTQSTGFLNDIKLDRIQFFGGQRKPQMQYMTCCKKKAHPFMIRYPKDIKMCDDAVHPLYLQIVVQYSEQSDADADMSPGHVNEITGHRGSVGDNEVMTLGPWMPPNFVSLHAMA